MAFKMKYRNLQKVVDELRSAVKAHGKQADIVEEHIDSMEGDSPMKRCWKGYKPNPDGRPASQQGSCVKK
tara:strand:+ start:3865 stop:4074 length:210 start_codon:yes stop_codon:yes gene_type:complete